MLINGFSPLSARVWTDHLGEVLPLIIRGNLFEEYDGTWIEGRDHVWILG